MSLTSTSHLLFLKFARVQGRGFAFLFLISQIIYMTFPFERHFLATHQPSIRTRKSPVCSFLSYSSPQIPVQPSWYTWPIDSFFQFLGHYHLSFKPALLLMNIFTPGSYNWSNPFLFFLLWNIWDASFIISNTSCLADYIFICSSFMHHLPFVQTQRLLSPFSMPLSFSHVLCKGPDLAILNSNFFPWKL